MSAFTGYDEDILLWSEQQAALIRRLGANRRNLPNELDLENVAEEIESVGRSELATVESQLQNILVQLIKVALEPDAEAVRHWKVEIVAFHGELRRRHTPSMRQRIEPAWLSALARELSVLAANQPEVVELKLSARSPVAIDDLVSERLDIPALVRMIQQGQDS